MYCRFVLTVTNDGQRTEENPLPLEASARLVIPGFRVKENLEGTIRRDAPTGNRNSQHALFILAGNNKSWRLAKGDVSSAFLKGDAYEAQGGGLYFEAPDERRGPSLPWNRRRLAKVLKGVFGLADAPREWFLRLSRCMREHGWTALSSDAASFVRRDSAGKLCGFIVCHVDDLLMTGNELAWADFMKMSRELGFGSLEEGDFVWCGKRIQRTCTDVPS